MNTDPKMIGAETTAQDILANENEKTKTKKLVVQPIGYQGGGAERINGREHKKGHHLFDTL